VQIGIVSCDIRRHHKCSSPFRLFSANAVNSIFDRMRYIRFDYAFAVLVLTRCATRMETIAKLHKVCDIEGFIRIRYFAKEVYLSRFNDF
jgi:hypothetical protein